MAGFHGKLPLTTLLGAAALAVAGCAQSNSTGRPGFWPFNREISDTVPGVPAPAERIAVLRRMRQKAAWAEPIEQERIASELATALQTESDPLIRIEMVRALAGYRTGTAASALETALHDSDPNVRIAACEAWAKRDDPRAAAKLSEVVSSDLDMDVRLAAVEALGDTRDPAAVAALGEALEDRDPAMQYRAVRSLRKVTEEDLGNDVNRWRQYVRGELPAEPPVSLVERIRQIF